MANIAPFRRCARPSRSVLALVVGASLFAVRGALAQAVPGEEAPAAETRAEDEAAAAELFRQGRAALDGGDYAIACAKLAESQRLSPRGGTLLNLARCHELEGKTASAWAEFDLALRQARREGRSDREAIARERLSVLEGRLSRLTVAVPRAADLSGLEVRRDGTEYGRAIWGEALPVDPGEHVVEASAPGRLPFRVSVRVGPDGDRQSVTLPVLSEAPKGAVSAGLRPASPPGAASGGPPYRTLGWAALGVGAAGVATSAVFGALALGERGKADDRCGGDNDPERCLDSTGVEANRRAQSFADVATLSGVAGLAFAGVGAYLVLSHPRPSRGAQAGPPTGLVVGPRGVSFVASF